MSNNKIEKKISGSRYIKACRKILCPGLQLKEWGLVCLCVFSESFSASKSFIECCSPRCNFRDKSRSFGNSENPFRVFQELIKVELMKPVTDRSRLLLKLARFLFHSWFRCYHYEHVVFRNLYNVMYSSIAKSFIQLGLKKIQGWRLGNPSVAQPVPIVTLLVTNSFFLISSHNLSCFFLNSFPPATIHCEKPGSVFLPVSCKVLRGSSRSFKNK